MDVKKEIFKAFKRKGLSIEAKASVDLARVLKGEQDPLAALQSVLDTIRSKIERKEVTTAVISQGVIESVVYEMTEGLDDLQDTSTQIIDAFSSPCITFNEHQRTYTVVKAPEYSLHGDAASKARMYRERYMLVQQRLLRGGTFFLRTVAGLEGAGSRRKQGAENAIELSTIESLLGDRGTRVLLGFLTQPTEGVWHLEDAGSLIPLNLALAKPVSPVLFTQGSIVIVEGALMNGVFHVSQLGAPPAESRKASLENMNITDPFGNQTRSDVIRQQQALEEDSEDTMFIVMSDLHLDLPHVIEKLAQVLAGFEDYAADTANTTPVFVLIGSFVSRPFMGSGGRAAHLAAFRSLADTIGAHPNLASRARFVVQPGPYDMGLSTVLPRRRLPEMLREVLESKVKNVSFVSNPFRIRFYTQELVFFREDLLRKVQRNCVMNTGNLDGSSSSSSSGDGGGHCSEIFSSLVETIIRQAHLLPLPLEARPVYWELDHALRLEPLPQLLVLADHVDQYRYEAEGTSAVNPGSFSSDGAFLVYYPSCGAPSVSEGAPVKWKEERGPGIDSTLLEARSGVRG